MTGAGLSTVGGGGGESGDVVVADADVFTSIVINPPPKVPARVFNSLGTLIPRYERTQTVITHTKAIIAIVVVMIVIVC